jgi:hypothetical protein
LKYLRKILCQHERELEETYGFKIEDVGVHSYRKGAHTYMNSGSTAGPSAAATCIQGGHTMGSVRDIYVLQEKAGDAYCGWSTADWLASQSSRICNVSSGFCPRFGGYFR